MKTTIKLFACAVAISAVLLACGDKGVNNPEQNIDPPYDPENFPSIVGSSVNEWMKEQLASGKNDRAQVRVADLLTKSEEKRRVSPIIGEFVSNVAGSQMDAWIALMTAKEIVELTKKYNGLSIEFPAPHGVLTLKDF